MYMYNLEGKNMVEIGGS